MKRCEEYEVELSAMLDGESDPATAVEMMDHICQCSSCRDFYIELRSFQSVVDSISPVPAERPVTDSSTPWAVTQPKRRWLEWLGAVPRWAWAPAVIIIAIGLWAAGSGVLTKDQGVDLDKGIVTIELQSGEYSVDDKRFVELASEILSADKRYQYQMYVILDQLRQNTEPGEAPFDGEVVQSEEGGEYSGNAFAHIGGRRVLD